MGFPYNCLIAPAILLDNPGLTREEFVEKLDQTHSSCMKEYKSNESWSHYDPKREDDRYHEGLDGLASILGIRESKEFTEFQKPRRDQNGILIRAPMYFSLPSIAGKAEDSFVQIHEKNVVKKSKRVNELAWDKLSIGSVWEECQIGNEQGIVTQIFNERRISNKRVGDVFDESGPKYEYNMKIKPFYRVERKETFKSREELWTSWPQFHPDRVYDWSQKNGSFHVDICDEKKFFWRKDKDKYYLDAATFDIIPASFRSGGLGYTDLLLTAGAVKHKAWKVLSYRGLIHFEEFLDDFPDVRQRYEKGIWDSHTSLFARKAKMTHFDLLRMRLESRIHT